MGMVEQIIIVERRKVISIP